MMAGIPTMNGRRAARWAWTIGIFVVLSILVIGPVLALIYQSFAPDRGSTGGFGLEHYRRLASPGMGSATLNTIWVSIGATVGSVFVGGGLAWLAARTDVPGRSVVQLSGMVPLFFSALVGALAWSALASPRTGYINVMMADLGIPFAFNVYTLYGIMFVLTLYYAPFAFLFIYAALTLASEDLEGAARVSGANEWHVTTKVTFPLVFPSIASVSVLIFVLTSENFPVVEILGSFARLDFLPTRVFRLVNEFPPRLGEAAAIGVVVLVLLWGMVWYQTFYMNRRSYVTIGGKGGQARRIRLGPWRWVGLAFTLLYLSLAAVLPTIALFIGAFRRNQFFTDTANLLDPQEFTMENFMSAMDYGPFRTGLRNSIILALAAAFLGVILNFLAAYSARRRQMYASHAIDYIALAPVAVPALILGLAFVAFWLRLPIPLYGTMAILIMAYVARFIPQGFESFSSTLVKVDEQLEDSAVTSGARRTQAMASITVPLLRSAFFSTGILLFILSFRELTAALFLYTPDTRVLSVVIYGQWVGGAWPRVASMSIVFTLVLFAAALFSRRGLEART